MASRPDAGGPQLQLSPDLAGELERLTQLHQQGALTNAEFTAANQQLRS